jgi:hemerythrin-like domain-containing protein
MTGPGFPVPDYTEIPVLGKKSIVYDFNYTSKIAPNTAAMIVVAAQAQPYGVQGAENALAFSHLNKGLYNRLDTVVVDSGTESNKEAEANSNVVERYIELRTYVENIYSGQGTGASSNTPAENAQQERELGVTQVNNLITTVPLSQVKSLVLLRLNAVYETLREAARNLEDKGELTALQRSYEEVKNKINAESNNSIADSLDYNGFGEADQKVEYLDSGLYNYVYDELETGYKSIYNIRDTEIEKVWTQLAIKQTGINTRSWF